MNILVTGSNGQLGSELREVADRVESMSFFFYDLPGLDITDNERVERVCREHDISAVVNCAAYTAVDRAEEDAEAAGRLYLQRLLKIGVLYWCMFRQIMCSTVSRFCLTVKKIR